MISLMKKRPEAMKFSNRLLMVITPIGVAIGLYEGWRLAGGLVLLMAAQLLILSLIGVALVRTVRRESREQRR
jgi:predicted MFS family arabinose efflux permease